MSICNCFINKNVYRCLRRRNNEKKINPLYGHHIDDIAILYQIKEFLGVGTVRINQNSCVYSIGNARDLLTVLLPLLDRNLLYTTKWLDYLDFKSVVIYLSTASTTRLSEERLVWVKTIMQGMNSNRTHYDYSLIPSLEVVDPFWLLGFIEGEQQ